MTLVEWWRGFRGRIQLCGFQTLEWDVLLTCRDCCLMDLTSNFSVENNVRRSSTVLFIDFHFSLSPTDKSDEENVLVRSKCVFSSCQSIPPKHSSRASPFGCLLMHKLPNSFQKNRYRWHQWRNQRGGGQMANCPLRFIYLWSTWHCIFCLLGSNLHSHILISFNYVCIFLHFQVKNFSPIIFFLHIRSLPIGLKILVAPLLHTLKFPLWEYSTR